MKGDGLEVESTVEVNGGGDALQGLDDTLNGGDVLLLESERSRNSGNSCQYSAGWSVHV